MDESNNRTPGMSGASDFGSGPSGTTFGTDTSGGTGNRGSVGSSNTNFGTSSSGTSGAFGVSTGSDTGICPTCGQPKNSGLDQFLGRLGINEDMVNNLKSQFQNVDIDEYLTTARDYLKNGSTKATSYAKENPGKVAAGVAALALGAGLIYAAVNRDSGNDKI